MTYARVPALLLTFFLACLSGHAAEQDNWYLANEWDVSDTQGVAYYEDNVTGIGQIYICNGSGSSSKISVYDLNGSLARNISIATNRYNASDLALDTNGTLYIGERYAVTCLENEGTFKWRIGKGNTSTSNYGTSGSGDGEFTYALGIAVQSSSGEVFVADQSNHRVQVLDKNGNFLRKFGSTGTAPGQLQNPKDVVFLPDGTLVVSDNSYLHYFQSNGTFIKRVNAYAAKHYVSVAKDGTLLSNRHLLDADGNSLRSASFISDDYSRTCFTPEGDLIESRNGKVKIWKRAYRTKGLPVCNVIPLPAVRVITQRAGTNIIDLDFEIIDPDDANATVGILAAQDGAFDDTSKWILPQTWVDGTGSKIGTPIATNQVHRVSWNVKPDWPDSTGSLQFEIICHDARRTAPVDLHFLTLPLPDGNLTISRSPLKDSDFESYAKFLLATGQAELNATSNEVQLPPVSVPSGDFVFTSAGKTGKDGPTSAEVNASYVGTPLEGNVTMTTQGIQEWTVPETGVYSIEVAGARGGWGRGNQLNNGKNNNVGGYGACMIGKFSLAAGEMLKIVVGQEGQSANGDFQGGGGGGGSFVWKNNSSLPLIIAGGGGGGAGHTFPRHGSDASIGKNGLKSHDGTLGGQNGSHGEAASSGEGYGGTGWNSSDSNSFGGQKFQGGNTGRSGGFGGGGSGKNGGGGGGGFSGGGGGNSYSRFGGGAGSFNSGSEKLALVNESKNAFVRIRKIQANTPLASTSIYKLLYDDRRSSGSIRFKLEQVLGTGYRIATPEEVQKASEAATAGGVNRWTANRPIQPRNLPNKVNEYGFDTGDHGERAWWVVEE